MTVRAFVIAGTILLAGNSGLVAQTTSQFGTCAYWQDQKSKLADPAVGGVHAMYRVGLAHGFVLGIGADLPMAAYAPRFPGVAWDRLVSRYVDGYVEALKRPAFLVDAFDQKCNDFKNRRVSLTDLGFVVLLEVGGLPADTSEKALEEMRARGDEYKDRVLQIVLRSP